METIVRHRQLQRTGVYAAAEVRATVIGLEVGHYRPQNRIVSSFILGGAIRSDRKVKYTARSQAFDFAAGIRR